MFSGFRRHPAQILQHDLIEDTLPDVMGCAGFTILFVSTAGEVVVVADIVCARWRAIVLPQSAQTTSPEYLFCSSIFVGRRLFFLTRCTISQISFGNDGRMRIFKHEAFFPWVLNFTFVLIGSGAEPVVHSVAKIDLIFQQVCNGTV